MNQKEQKMDEILNRGVAEVIERESLEKGLKSGKKLRVKLGIDPTSPNIHIGRAVALLKLKDFQDLGHKAVFIVGDFTGLIGDTSDKESERPMLSEKQVKQNMKTYVKQAFKILDPKKTEIHYNSKWLKKLNFTEIGKLADNFSLHEFESRENINLRLKSGKRVSLKELLYPIMQGYDSVAVKADVELGGIDQKFNLLAGREIQRHYKQKPQDTMTLNYLEGLDGRKMSSSWGNTINLLDSAKEMFGKVMSLKDEFIENYFILVTRLPFEEVEKIKKLDNPRDQKLILAKEIVKMYYGEKETEKVKNEFNEKNYSEEILKSVNRPEVPILDLLYETGLVESKSEAKRQILQKGVKINGKLEEDWQKIIKTEKGTIIQVGKRKTLKLI